MGRPLLSRLTPQRLLIASIAVMVVLAFAPLRLSGWVGWFGDLSMRLIAPVSHPVTQFARWISPARVRELPERDADKLQQDAEHWRALYLRERKRSTELRDQLEAIQSGLALHREIPVTLATAPVIGTSSDLASGILRVKLGTASGVGINTVATVRGVHLLGRVVRADTRHCEIRPITDRHAGPLLGRIVLGDDDSTWLLCTLRPAGDGSLVGPVEDRPDQPDLIDRLARGQDVLLDDDAWPAHAQGLMIGRIERIEPSPDQPLRQRVRVRPSIDLARVKQVVLRIEQTATARAATTGESP